MAELESGAAGRRAACWGEVTREPQFAIQCTCTCIYCTVREHLWIGRNHSLIAIHFTLGIKTSHYFSVQLLVGKCD